MDLSDFLKSGYQVYHKQKGAIFGNRTNADAKSKQLKAHRKSLRNKLISQKRLIDGPLSPFKTPSAKTEVKERVTKEDLAVKKRLEMLKQWKEQKNQKLKEEKAKTKPIFKVTHVSLEVGLPNLENVNKVIKGRQINSKVPSSNRKKSPPPKYQFAPKEYQFKGPANVKPICRVKTPVKNNAQTKVLVRQRNVCEDTFDGQKYSTNNKGAAKKVTINTRAHDSNGLKNECKLYRKTPAKVNKPKIELNRENKENIKVSNNTRHYDLRSRRVVTTVSEDKPVHRTNKTKEERGGGKSGNLGAKPKKSIESKVKVEKEVHRKAKSILRRRLEDDYISKSTSQLSEDYPIQQREDASPKSDLERADQEPRDTNIDSTPKSKSHPPVVYISPFVTISRGKNSARKEFHSRKSKGGLYDSSPDVENSTGPKAGAAYFHRLLDGEMSRIQELCDEWNLYKDEQKPPEEACDMINMAIGQSQLLMGKKFTQFRKLIHSCENGDSEMPITCEDLHGYWDTAYIQVENLNQRFQNLTQLRANNWEEVIPEKKVTTKKVAKPKVKVQATSRLKDAIRAARSKAKSKVETVEDNGNTFDGGFYSIHSPEKRECGTPSTRKSATKDSLLINTLLNESMRRDSLIMWKTTRAAKSLERDIVNTPERGILKSGNSTASTRRPKSVLFKKEESCESPRTSRRLTRAKLF